MVFVVRVEYCGQVLYGECVLGLISVVVVVIVLVIVIMIVVVMVVVVMVMVAMGNSCGQ